MSERTFSQTEAKINVHISTFSFHKSLSRFSDLLFAFNTSDLSRKAVKTDRPGQTVQTLIRRRRTG